MNKCHHTTEIMSHCIELYCDRSKTDTTPLYILQFDVVSSNDKSGFIQWYAAERNKSGRDKIHTIFYI